MNQQYIYRLRTDGEGEKMPITMRVVLTVGLVLIVILILYYCGVDLTATTTIGGA